MSGTNAHLVIEGYADRGAEPDAGWGSSAGPARPVAVPPPEPHEDLDVAAIRLDTRTARVLSLSAKDGPALRELAESYAS